jgi:outer membrane protein OmpA-like peptidoglycan-associated protein
MKRTLITILLTAATVIAAIGIWTAWNRYRELQSGFHAEKQRTAALTSELEARSRALDHARTETAAANRAAEEKSAAAATTMAELERSEQGRIQAEQQSAELSARENQARQQLEEIRKRRDQELDRMREALNRIAPTRRTASGMVIELANDSFQFDFDKSALRPENRELLSRIAGVLLASEGYRVFVYGHTDDVGAADYNQGLSERRAESVARYLQQAGVPEELMQVKGFGKSSPRVVSETREARQKNRRVEIGVVDSIIEYEGLER